MCKLCGLKSSVAEQPATFSSAPHTPLQLPRDIPFSHMPRHTVARVKKSRDSRRTNRYNLFCIFVREWVARSDARGGNATTMSRVASPYWEVLTDDERAYWTIRTRELFRPTPEDIANAAARMRRFAMAGSGGVSPCHARCAFGKVRDRREAIARPVSRLVHSARAERHAGRDLGRPGIPNRIGPGLDRKAGDSSRPNERYVG
ncbi:hypothetical protein NUW54_g6219 [Trametes sanguinea]|uniref:Uncharacterized protein n=1 Tax=Trametes sanguinea TaxID=158606 RepID=A0ACC1PSY8_9APHY|nr:hypothetical protein NUW54_g6219 [Trametes sanguinea]